jgi:hypothetical protein
VHETSVNGDAEFLGEYLPNPCIEIFVLRTFLPHGGNAVIFRYCINGNSQRPGFKYQAIGYSHLSVVYILF